MTFQLSYTPRGSRHHPEPHRCREADKREEMAGGKRGRGGESGKQEQRYGEGRGVTFSPTAYLHELLLLSMYYSLDGH